METKIQELRKASKMNQAELAEYLALTRQPSREAHSAAYAHHKQFILRVIAILTLIFLFLENFMLFILYVL